jgi:signal transduction histidine kinase
MVAEGGPSDAGADPGAGAGSRRGLRVRLGSVRVRTTTLATLVVGLTLALGGVALVVGLRVGLTRSVERAVRQQAAAAAEVVSTTGQTPGLVQGQSDGDDDTVAQLLDADGNVMASSPELSEEADDPADPAAVPPLAPGLTPGHKATVRLVDDDESYLAVAVATRTPEGDRRTVVVAGTLEVVEESAELVGFLLTLGLPLLLLVVAVTTWRMVGRALAPVEAIRTTAEGVSVADLSGRVPTPTSADEVARLATTMNHMLDRLEDGQDRQRRFVADASHELRSPVAVLRQHAEVARAHPGRTTPDELAGTVLAEALRMQRLVDDLLLLARADEHSLGLRRRPLDLDDIVLHEIRRVRATSTVSVDAGAVSAGPVDGDADALQRAVRNVVDNAARHAAGQLAVSLSVRPGVDGASDADDAGTVVLVVDDDGPGVPPDQRRRVFERFVRLDDARARDGGGSGLGLAIVAEVVAAHGGTVELSDAPDLGGARVEIKLPARS